MHAPAKITLKNQTKMTLNQRFTAIMKSRPAMSSPVRSTTQRPASEKNRRLAALMEKRTYPGSYPGSAMVEQRSAPQPSHHKPSVLERLGQRRGGVVPHVAVIRGSSLGGRGFRAGTLRGGVHKQHQNNRVGVFSGGRFGGQRLGQRGQRGGGGMRGRGRGSQRGRGGSSNSSSAKPVSKEDLDSALDSYMSKSGKGNTDS